MRHVSMLGFKTLGCGCIIGRYRELATSREVVYCDEKGSSCDKQEHRRNHTLPSTVDTPQPSNPNSKS
jgi:hypothetical protein